MSSQTLVTIILGIVEIVSFSIMSRLLTQEDFGYYAAITAITTIFASFSETGIGSAVIQKKNLTKGFINNAFTISLIFGIFISLLLFSLAKPLARSVADVSMTVPLMLMSITLLLNCLTSVNISLMQRKLQFLRVGLINLIALVITTIIAIILAYNGYGYYAIIAKAVLTSIITWVLSLFLCKTHFGIELDRVTFKQIFSFSGWLMASVLFRNLAHQVDRLLMPRLLSVSALGSYNRPKEFIEQISSKLNGIFDTALFPVLSSIQDNKSALRSSFLRSLSLINTFSLFLTTLFIFNSGLIIRIFLGSQWIELRPVMIALAGTLLFNIDGRLADCYLRSLAMTKQQFYFRIFETVLKIIGIVIGYKWGIMGIAISVVVTNSIAKVIKIIYVGEKIDINPSQSSLTIIKSWMFSVILIPICITALFILPNTVCGDVVMTSIYIILTGVLFILFPNIVSKTYKEEIYDRIMSVLKKKIGR